MSDNQARTVDKDIKTGLWQSVFDGNFIKVRSVGLTVVRYSNEGCSSVYDMSVSDLLDYYLLCSSDKIMPVINDTPKAVQILNEAVQIMAERGKSYDKSGGQAERSMPKIVAMFNALTGHELTPAQGWKFMACLKLARSEQGEHREDNYLDGAAYFALAGEEAGENEQ